MSNSLMVRGAVLLVAAAFVATGCTCGKDDAPGSREPVTADGESQGMQLEPLPDAPKLDIPKEAFPGADGPLAVVVARPQGPVKGEVRPTVTFSKPVKSLGEIESQRAGDREKPFAVITPQQEGEWRWLGSASAEFVPKGLVPYSTSFQVTIRKGLRAIDGSELPEDHTFSFSTPVPELQDVAPGRGFAWLKPAETIKLVFNQPVKDLAAHARFEVEGEAKPWPIRVQRTVSIADERRAEAARNGERRHERMSAQERGFRNEQTRYEIASNKRFPPGRAIKLVIDPTLRGEQGPLTALQPMVVQWRTYGDFRVTGVQMCSGDYRCPRGPLAVVSTNPIDLESLKPRLKISPPVELDWERTQSHTPRAPDGAAPAEPRAMLSGNFKPGTAYQVQIEPGVKDAFGQVLSGAFTGEGRTDDLGPALFIGSNNALVESVHGTKFPIELVNLRDLEVAIWNLTPAEAAQVAATPHYSERQALTRPPDFSETQRLDYPRNEQRVHTIDLSRVLGGAKTGLALVRLNSPQLQWRPKNGFPVLVQVTNLVTHFKFGPAKSLAWVTALGTGAPVRNALVTVLDENGKVRWSGTTDEAGIADMPGAVQMGLSAPNEWDAPFALAQATLGQDVGISSSQWADGLSAWDFQVESGWEGAPPVSVGFVFTDRGIYRPGDKVFIKGVARYRSVGALKAPEEGSTLNLTVRDSKGETVKQLEVEVTPFGTFHAEIQVPKTSPTGRFDVEATGSAPSGKLGFTGSFRVEEYRAPQFKVDVEAERPDLVAGDKLKATVSARYLFGAAMRDAKVRWSAHRTSTSFTPKGTDGFSFDQETWWWDDNAPGQTSSFFASGDARVDAKGLATVEAGTVEAPGDRTFVYTVEAEVEDVNRQSVAARAQVTVHPAALYVGLRPPTGFPKTGEDVAVDVLVTDVVGQRTAGKPVQVEILRRTWKSVRQKNAGGGFTTVSEPAEEKVHSCAVTSAAPAPARCVFKPSESGFYITRATVSDDRGRKHTASIGVYVTGPGFVAWQRDDTERIDLVPDRTGYDVGQVAKVLVKSPYPEATALVTVEREGVLDRRVVALKGSVNTLDIPIVEAMVPNVFVSVLVIRPRVAQGGLETGEDPGRPAVRMGLVKLPVERSTKRLGVLVRADRAEYRPGDEISVNVSVKNHRDQGVPAEVTLYAVDESVLRLTGYRTPDPLAAMYPERALSVRLGEPLIHLVRKRHYGEKGEEAGGGGGESSTERFRSNFQTTVYFNPRLQTDAQGRAQAKFKLPDNLTTFRIMAVAVTKDDRFGGGDSSVQVNKPLLALQALPRFVRVGDRFEAGVVVHARGTQGGDVLVSAAAKNAKLLGAAERRVTVSEGKPREVRFGFTVEQPGVATFRFRVSRGADTDGVEVSIPVELPVGFETVATYGDTRESSVEGLSPPGNVRQDVGGLELTLASTALGNFQEGFRQLVDYPYGCLEQQASRLIPFVALRELAPRFGIAWRGPNQKDAEGERAMNAFFRRYLFDPLEVSGESDPDEVIRKTIASIEGLQNHDGAFLFWSDAACPSSHASVYATLALHRARQVGYDVDTQRLARAQGFVEKVASGHCSPCEWSCSDETRVFASWVLARSGRPLSSRYGELFKKREGLTLFSRALLADAMFVGGGNREQARQLLQEVLNHAKESPRGVHFEELQQQTYAGLWHSDTRTTGAVLQTLSAIAPDHPHVAKISRYLTSARKGGQWRTTQEAAFSLMGLTDMVRAKEKETPAFAATVLLGDDALARSEFKGRTTTVATTTIPIRELLKKSGGADKKLSFKKEGDGVLYYSAVLKYSPEEVPQKPLESGLYVQRWFEPFTGGGRATRFFAGDLVRVRLRVASNQERHFAAIEVPLPAGLEPVDTSLSTTTTQTASPDEEGRGPGYDYESAEDQQGGVADPASAPRASPWATTFWSPFNHIEQRDDRIVVFADHLPPGIHVASFVARATTPGSFLLKAARGELMYEPEVFGRSEGGTFQVVVPQEVSKR